MNIDPNKLQARIKYDQFIQEAGWCSNPFFGVSTVLIEILSARGVGFAFNRIGPVVSLDGKRLFLMTTGYTPPASFNLPLSDISTNYIHAVDMQRIPIFQTHCSQQENLIEFASQQFKELFAKQPMTDDEKNKLTQALANSKV